MESDVSFIKDTKFNFELGNSFRKRSGHSLHTLRYDFKPASVDLNQEGYVNMGEGNEVTITLPHLQGAKTLNTRYKGSKKPALKECVLIYNPQTSTFILEKISSQIQVKKTRSSDNARSSQMPTVLPPAKVPKIVPGKKPGISKVVRPPQETRRPDAIAEERQPEQLQLPTPITAPHPIDEFCNGQEDIGNLSSSEDDDDDSSSDSSSSDDNSSEASIPQKPSKTSTSESQLQLDLELSESDSESD